MGLISRVSSRTYRVVNYLQFFGPKNKQKMPVDPAKLAKLQARAAGANKAGGARRKKKVVPKANSTSADSKKLLMSLKKITPSPIDAVDEVNMFKDDGTVIHFKNPSVLFSPQSQGFTISGANDHKKISEIPQVLNQLGLEGLKAWAASAETRDILSNMSSQAGMQMQQKGAAMGLSGDVPEFEADDVE